MLFEGSILFLAGFLGGILNSIAGGGSFITFPALMFVGIPPIIANATNTFASCAGYLSGAYAFRKDIANDKQKLPLIVVLSFVGGSAGAWLLLQTPEQVFLQTIPWLLLFASLLFVFGGKLNHYLKKMAHIHKHASALGVHLLSALLLLVCLYGGFFNAGLGIISLSYLALAGYQNINVMNGIKLLISSCVAMVAIGLFIIEGAIDWYSGIIVLSGSLIGGFFAAKISRSLPQVWIRNIVIVISFSITGYYFYDVYVAK